MDGENLSNSDVMSNYIANYIANRFEHTIIISCLKEFKNLVDYSIDIEYYKLIRYSHVNNTINN